MIKIGMMTGLLTMPALLMAWGSLRYTLAPVSYCAAWGLWALAAIISGVRPYCGPWRPGGIRWGLALGADGGIAGPDRDGGGGLAGALGAGLDAGDGFQGTRAVFAWLLWLVSLRVLNRIGDLGAIRFIWIAPSTAVNIWKMGILGTFRYICGAIHGDFSCSMRPRFAGNPISWTS